MYNPPYNLQYVRSIYTDDVTLITNQNSQHCNRAGFNVARTRTSPPFRLNEQKGTRGPGSPCVLRGLHRTPMSVQQWRNLTFGRQRNQSMSNAKGLIHQPFAFIQYHYCVNLFIAQSAVVCGWGVTMVEMYLRVVYTRTTADRQTDRQTDRAQHQSSHDDTRARNLKLVRNSLLNIRPFHANSYKSVLWNEDAKTGSIFCLALRSMICRIDLITANHYDILER
jgi:hypothetical protein